MGKLRCLALSEATKGSTKAERVHRGGRQAAWQCKSLGRVAHGDEGRGALRRSAECAKRPQGRLGIGCQRAAGLLFGAQEGPRSVRRSASPWRRRVDAISNDKFSVQVDELVQNVFDQSLFKHIQTTARSRQVSCD